MPPLGPALLFLSGVALRWVRTRRPQGSWLPEKGGARAKLQKCADPAGGWTGFLKGES